MTLGEQAATLWDPISGEIKRRIPLPEGSDMSMALASDGRTMVTGGAAAEPLLWDLATGKVLGGSPGCGRGLFFGFFSRRSKPWPQGETAGCVVLWDAATGAERIAPGGNAGGAY